MYKTADEHWVCLSASTQGMAEKLFRAIGRAELITDRRFATNAGRLQHVAELDAIIAEFIGRQSQLECLRFFQDAGVTVGPIYDMADIERDPHFKARGIAVELPDAEMGTVPVHSVSPRLTATPGGFRRGAPRLGEHTREVLLEAGYSETEIEALCGSEVVRTADQEAEKA